MPRIPRIPKAMLVDNFVHKPKAKTDRYNQPTFGQETEVKYCRIDRSTVYSVDERQRKVLRNAVIFCYAGLTEPFMTFKEGDIVHFDGKDHSISKVVPVTMPYSSDLFAVELEVV